MYAAVSSYDENGSKSFIIDKNLNQVSETLDGDSFSSCLEVIGGELFRYLDGEDYVFATFASKTSSSNKPAVKVVNYSDKTTGITASANEGVIAEGAETENPNTGVTGLTTAFGLIAVTSACVIVGKKRK